MCFIENVLFIFDIFKDGDLAAYMDADSDGLVQARELALWANETGRWLRWMFSNRDKCTGARTPASSWFLTALRCTEVI